MAFEGLSEKLGKVFKKLGSRGKLTESDIKEAMREVKLALLEADVSYKVVKTFVAKVSERAVGEEVMNSLTPSQQVIKIVRDELISLMDGTGATLLDPPADTGGTAYTAGTGGTGTEGANAGGTGGTAYTGGTGGTGDTGDTVLGSNAARRQEMLRRKRTMIAFPSKPPLIIMMCGLQGSGKTTHAAKLAKYFKKQGHRPLLVACDVYRPAAIDQLKVVGEKAGVHVFDMGQIKPEIIAKQGLAYAKDYGNDVVIIDTAGRLHIDEALMEELKRIKEETKPHEIMLVVDAMTGQDAVNVAKSFDETVGIDSILMSKLDSDTRGGAALSVLAVTGKPIKFIGTGEKLDEFEEFHADRMASRILGMGDVLSLIERAETTIDSKSAEKMTRRLEENKFDMNDLLDQIEQISKMGSLKSIVSMIPGVGSKIKDADIDEKQLVHTKALIQSMTLREREKPSIINPKRKRRIAAGSGMKVEDVNRLLNQYKQMQQMMKKLGIKKKVNGKKGLKINRQAKKMLAGMDMSALKELKDLK